MQPVVEQDGSNRPLSSSSSSSRSPSANAASTMMHVGVAFGPASAQTPSVVASDPRFRTLRKRQRRKKGKRDAVQDASHLTDGQSASASSWGAADVSEDDDGLSSTSSDEEAIDRQGDKGDTYTVGFGDGTEGASSVQGQDVDTSHPPPRKRRHLAAEDVGRFANMTIDRNSHADISSTEAVRPTEVTVPQSPSQRPTLDTRLPSHLSISNADLIEVPPSTVEEPDDVDMRARRGPQTIEMEENKFFVSSLSDSSSDEEDAEQRKEKDRIDRAMRNASQAEVSRALGDPSDGLGAQNEDERRFVINGQLVSRLQALEWQRRTGLARDRAAAPLFRASGRSAKQSDASTPPESEDREAARASALILWRQPDDFSTNFGKTSIPNVNMNLLGDGNHPPIVLEDGQYAYVHRSGDADDMIATGSGSPSAPGTSPMPLQSSQDAMDID